MMLIQRFCLFLVAGSLIVRTTAATPVKSVDDTAAPDSTVDCAQIYLENCLASRLAQWGVVAEYEPVIETREVAVQAPRPAFLGTKIVHDAYESRAEYLKRFDKAQAETDAKISERGRRPWTVLFRVRPAERNPQAHRYGPSHFQADEGMYQFSLPFGPLPDGPCVVGDGIRPSEAILIEECAARSVPRSRRSPELKRLCERLASPYYRINSDTIHLYFTATPEEGRELDAHLLIGSDESTWVEVLIEVSAGAGTDSGCQKARAWYFHNAPSRIWLSPVVTVRSVRIISQGKTLRSFTRYEK